MAAAAGKCRLDTRRDGLLHARHVRGRVADQMAVWCQAQTEMHHNGGMRHGSSPSQERTRTGLENRLSMLPARSRPADAPVKAKALYRARMPKNHAACAGQRAARSGGESVLSGKGNPPLGCRSVRIATKKTEAPLRQSKGGLPVSEVALGVHR